jgi:hypothetical protein
VRILVNLDSESAAEVWHNGARFAQRFDGWQRFARIVLTRG